MELSEILRQTRSLVFFGGAGVSTESNIPDFRSDTGLYKKKYAFPAEVMLSHMFFMQDPEHFFEFYFNQMLYPDAKPNGAHLALAKLEEKGICKAIVTQNIDGLHQMAGSKVVYELHGSVHRNTCMGCRKHYTLDEILDLRNSLGIPICPVCGKIIKPDVVLYEESLDENVLSKSVEAIMQADTLIVGGTSLAVYPAAGLLQYFQGNHLVLINKSSTPMDHKADLVIHDSIGEVLSSSVANL